MATTTDAEKLERSIGPRALALSILNIVVGSGIFVIPALIAEGLGATAILAYLVCGLVIFLIGLCFAEMGSRTNVSGGLYAYVEQSFGPFAGFLASSVYWIGGCVVADAAVANALVGFLQVFFPGLEQESGRVACLFIVFATLAFINVRSAKTTLRLLQVTALVKLLPLVILVIVAARYIDPGNLRWEVSPGFGNIGQASLLLFFAFIGMEAPLSNGGEIRNPKRTVPLGILFGIGGVLLLYISIQLVTQGVLGSRMSTFKAAPLAAVADIAVGQAGNLAIVITSAVSILGMLAGEIFSIPRVLFASARNGQMPRPLARVHPRFATPHVAVIFYASIGFILAVTGSFRQLAIISSSSVLLIYFGVMMAAIRMKLSGNKVGNAGFTVPGGPVIPALAGLAIIWLLSNLAKKELAALVLFIVLLSIVYYVNRMLKRRSKIIPVQKA